jgi:hypothetical protein
MDLYLNVKLWVQSLNQRTFSYRYYLTEPSFFVDQNLSGSPFVEKLINKGSSNKLNILQFQKFNLYDCLEFYRRDYFSDLRIQKDLGCYTFNFALLRNQ